jgi:hypothetical protein
MRNTLEEKAKQALSIETLSKSFSSERFSSQQPQGLLSLIDEGSISVRDGKNLLKEEDNSWILLLAILIAAIIFFYLLFHQF